jgi:hypothetical protein
MEARALAISAIAFAAVSFVLSLALGRAQGRRAAGARAPA